MGRPGLAVRDGLWCAAHRCCACSRPCQHSGRARRLLAFRKLALGARESANVQPVLPAAIEQDIIIALRPTSSSERKCRLANILPSFKPCEFTLTHSAEKGWDAGLIPPKEGGGWENYVKVAILECLARYFPDGPGEKAPVGLDLLVSGNVPPGAGLSVSWAWTFVVTPQLTTPVLGRVCCLVCPHVPRCQRPHRGHHKGRRRQDGHC